MLRSCDLVFDDVVQSTTAVYTDPKWNQPMGVADTFAVMAIASQASSGATLTVTPETSPDGVNWFAMADAISAYSLSATDKSLKASDPTINGTRLVRLKIVLGGTNPSARLQLWFTGRDFTL